jgi:hypothetical protein
MAVEAVIWWSLSKLALLKLMLAMQRGAVDGR